MKILVALISLGFGFCYADNINSKNLSCPTPIADYTQIESRLKQLKDSMALKAECRGLSEKLNQFEGVYNGLSSKKVKSILSLKQELGQSELSINELTEVESFVKDATSFIAQIVQDINNQSPECMDLKGKPETLEAMASITQSLTQMVAPFTGPYGVPIALGGQMVAGILSGISNAIVQHRNLSPNFDDKTIRSLYKSSICIYHDIRKEIDYLARPDEKIQELEKLRCYLQYKTGLISKIDLLSGKEFDYCKNRYQGQDAINFSRLVLVDKSLNPSLPGSFFEGVYCSECRDYVNLHLKKSKFSNEVLLLIQEVNNLITSKTNTPTNAYLYCDEISRTVFRPGSAFTRVSNLINTEKGYAQSCSVATYGLEQIKQHLDLIEKSIPTSVNCFSIDQQKIQFTNERSSQILNSFIRTAYLDYFDYQLENFKKLADQKYVSQTQTNDRPQGYPLGSYTAYSLERSDWAKNEISKLKGNLAVGINGSISSLLQLNEEIEHLILRVAAPDFIFWQLEKSNLQYQKYLGKLKLLEFSIDQFLKTGKLTRLNDQRLTKLFSAFKNKRQVTKEKLGQQLEVIKNKKIDLSYVVSEVSSLTNFWLATSHQMLEGKDYCTFFGKAGLKLHALARNCELFNQSELLENLKRDSETTIIDAKKFIHWAQETQGIGHDYVADLSRHIKEWNGLSDQEIFGTP